MVIETGFADVVAGKLDIISPHPRVRVRVWVRVEGNLPGSNFLCTIREAHSEPCHTSEMKRFARIVTTGGKSH